MMKGSVKQVARDTAASNHHSAQANFHQFPPHAGTQTKTIMLMIVANPIGNVPIKRLCAGCRIIAIHIFGYRVYRRTVIVRKMTKSKTFNPKMMYEMYWSHVPL